MSVVTSGYTFTGASDPVTFSKLNLLGQPTVTIGINEVTAAMISNGGTGYATGAGGAVTQLTNRTTTVVLNKICGAITLFTASGSTTPATFTVTNSLVAATDLVILNQKSGADLYELFVTNKTAGAFKITFFTTGGTTSEVVVISFGILKGVEA